MWRARGRCSSDALNRLRLEMKVWPERRKQTLATTKVTTEKPWNKNAGKLMDMKFACEFPINT